MAVSVTKQVILEKSGVRSQESGVRRKKEEGRRKKEEGRRKKEEGRRKKEGVVWILIVKLLRRGILNCKLLCIGEDMITVSPSMNS